MILLSLDNTLDLILIITFSFIIGASIGSFLNVVIYRLPLMIMSQFRCDCYQTFGAPLPQKSSEKLNLGFPPSRCPNCLTKIAWYYNVPILGYFFTKRRCQNCHTPISWVYPALELFTAIGTALIVYNNPDLVTVVFYLMFFWLLIPLAVIDAKHQWLPDSINYMLMWLGLLYHTITHTIPLEQAIYGVIVAYLLFYSIYWIFKLCTGRDGLGFGDFKLFAALGAWVGIWALPQILLISSILALMLALAFRLVGKLKAKQAFAFGPFLAIAGILVLFFPKTIQRLQSLIEYSVILY